MNKEDLDLSFIEFCNKKNITDEDLEDLSFNFVFEFKDCVIIFSYDANTKKYNYERKEK